MELENKMDNLKSEQQELEIYRDYSNINNFSLGRYLRFIRKNKNKSMKKVADEIKKSEGYISKIERDQIKPSDEQIKNLAAVLDIDERVLFQKAGRLPDKYIAAIEGIPVIKSILDTVMYSRLPEANKRELLDTLNNTYLAFIQKHS